MSDETTDFLSNGGIVLDRAEFEIQKQLMLDDAAPPKTFYAENTAHKRFVTVHKLVEIAAPENELCNLNMNYMIGRFIDIEKYIYAQTTIKLLYYGFLAKYVHDTKIAIDEELAKRAHLADRGGMEKNGI